MSVRRSFGTGPRSIRYTTAKSPSGVAATARASRSSQWRTIFWKRLQFQLRKYNVYVSIHTWVAVGNDVDCGAEVTDGVTKMERAGNVDRRLLRFPLCRFRWVQDRPRRSSTLLTKIHRLFTINLIFKFDDAICRVIEWGNAFDNEQYLMTCVEKCDVFSATGYLFF